MPTVRRGFSYNPTQWKMLVSCQPHPPFRQILVSYPPMKIMQNIVQLDNFDWHYLMVESYYNSTKDLNMQTWNSNYKSTKFNQRIKTIKVFDFFLIISIQKAELNRNTQKYKQLQNYSKNQYFWLFLIIWFFFIQIFIWGKKSQIHTWKHTVLKLIKESKQSIPLIFFLFFGFFLNFFDSWFSLQKQ